VTPRKLQQAKGDGRAFRNDRRHTRTVTGRAADLPSATIPCASGRTPGAAPGIFVATSDGDPLGLSLDVGVDSHSFAPVSLEIVADAMRCRALGTAAWRPRTRPS
jgi:hypothetical protein